MTDADGGNEAIYYSLCSSHDSPLIYCILTTYAENSVLENIFEMSTTHSIVRNRARQDRNLFIASLHSIKKFLYPYERQPHTYILALTLSKSGVALAKKKYPFSQMKVKFVFASSTNAHQ